MHSFHSYSPEQGHGLAHDPIKSLIAPRPIGWISTYGANGVANIAPYSFFNLVAEKPPILGFSSNGLKHSAINAIESGCFAHNIVDRALAEQMVKTADNLSATQSEFEHAGLAIRGADVINAPMVDGALAVLECQFVDHIPIKDRGGRETDYHLILGEVARVHIAQPLLSGGMIDTKSLAQVARLGYREYSELGEITSFLPASKTR